MRILSSVFRSKIGLTILLLVTGIFVGSTYSKMLPNKLYVLRSDTAFLTGDPAFLSTYTLTMQNVRTQTLQIPPSPDTTPLLVPTSLFLSNLSSLPPNAFNVILTFTQPGQAEQTIEVFEAYNPIYAPSSRTLTWQMKIYKHRSLPLSTFSNVTAFITLKN